MWRVVVMNQKTYERIYIPCKDLEEAEEVEKIINHVDYSTDIEEIEGERLR